MFYNLPYASITFCMLLSPSIGFYALFSEFGPSLSYLILSYLISSHLISSHLSDLLLASWVLVLGWLQISKRLSSCVTTPVYSHNYRLPKYVLSVWWKVSLSTDGHKFSHQSSHDHYHILKFWVLKWLELGLKTQNLKNIFIGTFCGHKL